MLAKLRSLFNRYLSNTPAKKRQRIMALDLLRGLFIICIVVNHNSGWTPSLINIFTGQGTLFASAAEGFFIISGLLVGYIYGPKVLGHTKDVFMKLWKRAGLLYLLTVGFTFVFVAWNALTPDIFYRMEPWQGSLPDLIFQTLTLQYAYGWHDFLRHYAVFMVLAPFVVLLCAARKWYIVAIFSALAWFTLGRAGILHPFSTWQIIFALGIIVGFYLPIVEQKWAGLNKSFKEWPYRLLLASALLTYLSSIVIFTILPLVHETMGVHLPPLTAQALQSFLEFRNQHILSHFIPRDYMSIYRIFFAALWFAALYAFVRRHENDIEKKSRGVISFFGRNSLFIFVLHAVLLFLQDMLVGLQPAPNLYINTLVHLALLVIVFAITYYWRVIRPRRSHDAEPGRV